MREQAEVLMAAIKAGGFNPSSEEMLCSLVRDQIQVFMPHYDVSRCVATYKKLNTKSAKHAIKQATDQYEEDLKNIKDAMDRKKEWEETEGGAAGE
jgi:hypothetical protein